MFPQTGSSARRFLYLVTFGLVTAVSAMGASPALGQASSNGVATSVRVSGIGMVSTVGNMAFIQIAGTNGSSGYKTGNPSCSTNGPGQWSFVLPLTNTIQEQMLNALVSAHASGQPVTLVGNGLCDTYSTVETLTNIIF
jgi:hypothetical protein